MAVSQRGTVTSREGSFVEGLYRDPCALTGPYCIYSLDKKWKGVQDIPCCPGREGDRRAPRQVFCLGNRVRG